MQAQTMIIKNVYIKVENHHQWLVLRKGKVWGHDCKNNLVRLVRGAVLKAKPDLTKTYGWASYQVRTQTIQLIKWFSKQKPNQIYGLFSLSPVSEVKKKKTIKKNRKQWILIRFTDSSWKGFVSYCDTLTRALHSTLHSRLSACILVSLVSWR